MEFLRRSTDSAESWAKTINAAARQTVESIVSIGRLFVAAKRSLPHGEFCRLFADHLVPFKRNTAEAFMRLANHPVISNADHDHNLPANWTVLNDLARIPADILLHGIAHGRLTPAITRSEVKAWRQAIDALPAPVVTTKAEARGALTAVQQKAQRKIRLIKITQLAQEGHRSDQIAAALGLHPATVKKELKKAGIVCVADKFTSRAHRLNADRIVDHMVQSAEDIAVDERLINFATLTPNRLDAWITSLLDSQRAIGHLVGKLRTQKERYDRQPKIDSPQLEDPTRSDQSDDRTAGVR